LLSNPAKLRAKIVEEAFELAAAKTKKDTVWEAADLIYIILVLCAERGIKLYDVSNELGRRNAEKSRYSKRL
jgi:phosphoribosyl-ATP pyrophosphohydrolase